MSSSSLDQLWPEFVEVYFRVVTMMLSEGIVIEIIETRIINFIKEVYWFQMRIRECISTV